MVQQHPWCMHQLHVPCPIHWHLHETHGHLQTANFQDKMLCKRSELERSILMLNATTSEVRRKEQGSMQQLRILTACWLVSKMQVAGRHAAVQHVGGLLACQQSQAAVLVI